MRKYLVVLCENFEKEYVELSDGQKANPETIANIIDKKCNHYNGYYCRPGDILCWSLIEE